jgi:hypothetical protein
MNDLEKLTQEFDSLFGQVYQYNYDLMKKSEKQELKGQYRFNDIFDLQNIDWVLCDATSRKNVVKEVSFAYENTTKDMTKLSEMFGLAKTTICSYLKTGYKCGWCSYTVEQSNRLSRFKNIKPFVIIDNQENIRHYFNGTNKDLIFLGNLFNNEFLNKCIKNSCRTHKPYKGINFRYADEYLPKEIIDEIKLQDNAEELFFNYLKQNKERS